MKKKKSGFIFSTVVIITLLITSVVLTVTVLNTAHAKDIINDKNRNKAYYIANAGLEFAYAAINTKSAKLNDLSPIEVAKVAIGTTSSNSEESNFIFTSTAEKASGKTNILNLSNAAPDGFIGVSLDGSITTNPDDIIGYIKLSGDLMATTENDVYFRIVCTAKINETDSTNFPTDTHTLTMFVFKSDPNNPKIYNGDKKTIN